MNRKTRPFRSHHLVTLWTLAVLSGPALAGPRSDPKKAGPVTMQAFADRESITDLRLHKDTKASRRGRHSLNPIACIFDPNRSGA